MGPKRRRKPAPKGDSNEPNPLRDARDKFRAHIHEHGKSFDVMRCINPFLVDGGVDRAGLVAAAAAMDIQLTEEEV